VERHSGRRELKHSVFRQSELASQKSKGGLSMDRSMLGCMLLSMILLSCTSNVTQKPASVATPPVTVFAVSSGDVSSNSAIVWARATGRTEISVQYDTDPSFSRPRSAGAAQAASETDFTAKFSLKGLTPKTIYYFRVRSSLGRRQDSSGLADGMDGQFRTAPAPDDDAPVSFLLGGDTGGQGYCRRVGTGYLIYSSMRALDADFYIQNGDGVYVDYACPESGPEPGWQNIPGDFLRLADPAFDWRDRPLVRETILAHYRYNWDDQHLKEFLRSISTYAQWDDHEVIDDFGAQWTFWNPLDERPGFPILVQEGLSVFLNYWPIARNPVEPARIYRSFRWGKNLELFLLDTRSYRSRNNLPDSAENGKTLLGKAQLAWLKNGLITSTATWKIVSSTCPLASSAMGGNYPVIGEDCWAHGSAPDASSQTGFTRELVDLMTFLDEHDVKNMVWIATDVHHVESTRYAFDGNHDGRSMVFHEFLVGPLSASVGPLGPFDNTLNPTHLFRKTGIFNFGYFRIERRDNSSHFIAEVRDENGTLVPDSVVDLTAE